MRTAFKGIGGLPGAKVAKLQQVEARKVAAMLSAREANRRRSSLKESIAAGQALQDRQGTDSLSSTQPQRQQQQQRECPSELEAGQRQQPEGSLASRVAEPSLLGLENGSSNLAQQQQQAPLAAKAEQLAAGAAAGAAAAAVSVRASVSKTYSSFKKSPD